MIAKKIVEEAMFGAIVRAATMLPPDVKKTLEEIKTQESDPIAIEHLRLSSENFQMAEEGKGLLCGDTGFPLFFVKIGKKVELEDGFSAICEIASVATRNATKQAYLRPTMVDPITRNNPGDNVGPGMPRVEVEFSDEIEGIEIIGAPKGGGSEIFGTFYRMLFPSDGLAGVCKFILDSIKEGCYSGKICPPAIVGVGIGGTADVCMKLAKHAALLRPLGRFNDDPEIEKLEKKLLEATKDFGLGPMGARGINSVMGLHIETALTHTAALPVAVNAQCIVGRRWKAIVKTDGNITYTGEM
jgi:tartrate/fumarate subfamily iron-sulfur-dependent hydro-lyase alpha chain